MGAENAWFGESNKLTHLTHATPREKHGGPRTWREQMRADGGDDVAACRIADVGKGGADRDVGHATAQSIRPADTTREQTLERCPNLALASAFFAAGTKGPFSPGS